MIWRLFVLCSGIVFLTIDAQGLGSNPCLDFSLHDCDRNAVCESNRPGFFECRCPPEFVDVSPDNRFPGRVCRKEENECALGSHHCDLNADCEDTTESYRCSCRPGWTDSSQDQANEPGRKCIQASSCSAIDCAPEAECRESPSGAVCQCSVGYVDISDSQSRPAGRICHQLVNECQTQVDDCSDKAQCIDTTDSFTCRCHDGYRDESPDLFQRPGRVCVKTFVPDPPECDVNDPLSCDRSKAEVCIFVEGTYKCQCPKGITRLPDGKCSVLNECGESRLNDCGSNSQCIDQAEGYTCQCQPGFADISPDANKPGRICRQVVDECRDPSRYRVDCHQNAVCVDTAEAFICRCLPGFADVSEAYNKLPGRRCVQAINECLDRSANDCSNDAICEDAKEGYICKCSEGFIDASPNITHYPGRICNKPKQPGDPGGPTTLHQLDICEPSNPRSCPNGEVCSDQVETGTFLCTCPPGSFRFDDGSCRVVAGCQESDCDQNAICSNVFDSFKCKCRPGFLDVSPDPYRRPGRKCRELINECGDYKLNDCSPFAMCTDARNGYACMCSPGYVDISSYFGVKPGRKCHNSSNECSHASLNTCDQNSDCVETPDGYTCQCYEGFVDVSTNAHLPSGRVCTVQTSCPKQATDLMFLIDGSGSIGSFVFRNEVLRFVREFMELFDIGPDNTRVGVIQYSDQIRHEFDFSAYKNKAGVLEGISEIQYLTGLTRTGAAIQHMVQEGFSVRRGARPISDTVARVAIVITDGRSQDNVTDAAIGGRQAGIQMFAIGVTDHVLDSELESIAGNRHRSFHVNDFTDLDTRLRSLIQKAACPEGPVTDPPPDRFCDPVTQTGCDRTRNEVCRERNGQFGCECPDGFRRNPVTRVCGGNICNPKLPTSCPNLETCHQTPYGNFRCACPRGTVPEYFRDPRTGFCVTETLPARECEVGNVASCPSGKVCQRLPSGLVDCVCAGNLVLDEDGNCVVIGSCNPKKPNACDHRRREECLPHPTGNYNTCQCPRNYRRHSVTDICLIDECIANLHDCHEFAKCTDTDDGFLCTCPPGFLDHSLDPIRKPGRVCAQVFDECAKGSHNCSEFAFCLDTEEGFLCRCKPGYVDFSPNPNKFPGIVCKKKVNECLDPSLNTCHANAECLDTMDSYKCFCKPRFVDLDELRNPGRNCQKKHNQCAPGNNDCDRQAHCIPKGQSYECVCPSQYRDKSVDPIRKPGRICIPVLPECDNPSHNDCDSPERAQCIETDEGYLCRCRALFLDVSPDPVNNPGRICKPLVDECAFGNHDCARDGGICEDTPDSYTCRCDPKYLDVSPDPLKPGRRCKRLEDECATGRHDCSPFADCIDTEDSYICSCKQPDYQDVSEDPQNKPGRRCIRIVNECFENRHDCSPNANCIDTVELYRCQCRDDFIDESPDPQRPGRVCRPKLVDECSNGQHDCSVQAICTDRAVGFTCRCKDNYVDDSPNRITRPGRICTLKPTVTPPECRLELINSCDQNLNEVCRLINGEPKCACPENYTRNSANVCSVINECNFPHLIDCSINADCIDDIDGYTCRCRDGYADKSPNPEKRSGRICQKIVNECLFDHLNDCHQFATCTNLREGFQCACKTGYDDESQDKVNRPGIICRELYNECDNPRFNTCDQNSDCTDLKIGYECKCREGYHDISPTPGTGRACKKIVNECEDRNLNDCDAVAICKDSLDSYRCKCPDGSRDISPNPAFPGRVCLTPENECETGRNDCNQNALCRDTEDSFTCRCKDGYTDRSPNPLTRPGRVCIELIDECLTGVHTCSAKADCRDLEDGYTCECKDGYVDRSTNRRQPGRVCTPPDVCSSTHDCSAAAICEPLGGGDYRCICIQGYVDRSQSPLTGRVCVRDNECRDTRLNNCSRNAICHDLANGYRCECINGYQDKSPDPQLRGRICERVTVTSPPITNLCQDPNLNDCSLLGTCRSLGPNQYTCECPPRYADRSPDPVNKPGRVCIPQPPVCLDASQNDCHEFAVCIPVEDSRKYTCRCRDGYLDESPDQSRPGRVCKESFNECLDASLNSCDRTAICEELQRGYRCRCPVNSVDESPDPSLPGRRCRPIHNECGTNLHNCSRFANCIDQEFGYTCQCKSNYHDNNPSIPGRQCILIINECESVNLNDCDRHARCIDLPGGYTCECNQPYRDESPNRNEPGRICRFNECSDPNLNKCDKQAICQNTDNGYYCHCNEGYIDGSPDPRAPGRICIQASIDPITPAPTPVPPGGIPCGLRNYCFPQLSEVCVAGIRCECRIGHSRREVVINGLRQPCVPVEQITIPLRVSSRGNTPLFWHSNLGDPKNPRYIELTKIFEAGIGQAVESTEYNLNYVGCDVNYIAPPRLYNASWGDGIMCNFTVSFVPGTAEKCQFWRDLVAVCRANNNRIGGSDLFIAKDQLDPCAPSKPLGQLCAPGIYCKSELGEVCLSGAVCGCPVNMKRFGPDTECKQVEKFRLPLWVIRKGFQNLQYNDSFANTRDPFYRLFVSLFEKGIGDAYFKTSLRQGYVTAEVQDILDPRRYNGTWDIGVYYNCTVYFVRGFIRHPEDTWNLLLAEIVTNNYEIATSDLYINPFQVSPYSPCFRSDCHPRAYCLPRGPNSYTCQCPNEYLDLDPTFPGRKCRPKWKYPECLNPEDNECDVNARCIELDLLYRCECLRGYVDDSTKGSIPGSKCVLDYCSDVDFCPTNTTCKNDEDNAVCQCNPGFMDIRKSQKRLALGLGDVSCLKARDVDECALGLTNCSGVAICTDLIIGYECACPLGYVDGNPSLRGRICGAQSCGLCNGHGDCVHDQRTNNVTCLCHPGFSGEYCQVVAGDVRYILVIILAIIFFLLALCCLLFLCLKCRCIKGKGLWYREPLFTYRKGMWPWSTLEASSSSEEGMSSAFGKSSDYYPEMAIPRAKLAKREQRHLDAGALVDYLDEGMRIPRPRLSRSGSVEQEGSGSVIFSDVHQGLPAGVSHYESGSDSETSSEYTTREEVERRVITDVTKTETRKTLADVHNTATAQFHVYPPIEGRKSASGGLMAKFGGVRREVNRKWHRVAAEAAQVASKSQTEQMDNRKNDIFDDSSFPGLSSERERGQSIAEFSVGAIQRDESEWGETATAYSQNRAMSEYSDRDLDSISEESQSDLHEQPDAYDKKVLVKNTHTWAPAETGRGGTEKFGTEVTSKSVKRETNLR